MKPNLILAGESGGTTTGDSKYESPSGRSCDAKKIASPAEHFQALARQLTSQAG
jgi:hypothetical protein